ATTAKNYGAAFNRVEASREFSKDEICASLTDNRNDWVRYNPDAFKNAYWLVNPAKIYSRTTKLWNPRPE
ncbi:uncharacterized protein N7518_003162, partial [Penicillium psychrosexuale]|uniref:uncharacterized protein n=1 Tax=Penicillium psychrosexuale TaxID=1002107 RepID=UPI0025450DE8